MESLQSLGEQWQTILIASAILLVLYVFWDRMSYGVKQRGRGTEIFLDRAWPFWGHIVDTIKQVYNGQFHLQIDEYYKGYGKIASSSYNGCHCFSGINGLEANSQDNPNNPVSEAACNALNRSASQRKLLALLAVLPFGIKIMEKFPHMWMSNMIPLLRMAEEIAVKRAGDGNLSRRKDVLDVMLAVSNDPAVRDSKKLTDTEVIAQSFVFLVARRSLFLMAALTPVSSKESRFPKIP